MFVGSGDREFSCLGRFGATRAVVLPLKHSEINVITMGGTTEKTIKISVSGQKNVIGTLRTKGVNRNLIIFVHGFAAHQNEHIFFNGSKFFSFYGYDSFRFNLYGEIDGSRNLENSTLQFQADDLACVLAHFRKGYSRIYLIGHSFGCPVILLSNLTHINALVLWEPSLEPKEVLRGAFSLPGTDSAAIKSRFTFLVSKRMIAEAKTLPSIRSLLKKIVQPIKIICAEDAGWKVGSELYYRNANEPKAFHLIKNANHNFDEDGAEEELFGETLKWINN